MHVAECGIGIDAACVRLCGGSNNAVHPLATCNKIASENNTDANGHTQQNRFSPTPAFVTPDASFATEVYDKVVFVSFIMYFNLHIMVSIVHIHTCNTQALHITPILCVGSLVPPD